MEGGVGRIPKKRARLMSPTAVVTCLTAMNAQVMLKKLERENVEAIDRMQIRPNVPADKHWPEPIKKEKT